MGGLFPGMGLEGLFGGTPNQGYGPRVDGTRKGEGFLGSLPMANGRDRATELSMGTNFDGRDLLIPSLIPSLSQMEIQHLLSGGKPTDAIFQKAVTHARGRIGQGRSPFFQDQDRRVPWMPSLPQTGTPINFGQNQQRKWGE